MKIITMQSLNHFPVNSKLALESPRNVINNASGRVEVLRDRVGNYIFVNSDNAHETHVSVFDKSGTKLIRRDSINVDKEKLIHYLQKTLGFTIERGN